MRTGRYGLPDVLALMGLGAVIYGVALIYVPLAWIIGGLGSLTVAWLVAKKESSL